MALPTSASPLHTCDVDDVLRDLNVNQVDGLTAVEALRRLELYGSNELKGSGRLHLWKLIAKNLFNPVNFVLCAAVVLSAVTGDVIEAVVVSAIIIVNTIMSLLPEYRSEKTLDALRKMSSPTASVLRDAVELSIPASNVVVGDIVLLREGVRFILTFRLFNSYARLPRIKYLQTSACCRSFSWRSTKRC